MGFFFNKPKKTYNDLEMVSVRGYKVGDQYYGKKIIKIEHLSPHGAPGINKVWLTFKDNTFTEIIVSRSECVFKNN
jgi:hypothetical protein